MTVRNALRSLILLSILNFFAFWYSGLVLGGDALNGKEELGLYFLGGQGRHVEVTAGVFHYSRIHAISVIVTHLLAMAASAGLYFLKDPFVTVRNKRRLTITLVVCGGLMAVGAVSGQSWIPMWLSPPAFLLYVVLELRDANKALAETRVPGS
jgi:hypothetical protein